MWVILGLFLDVSGFVILFYNGNFNRNFNRLNGFSIYSDDEGGQGGGMRVIEKSDKLPRILDYVGFGSIVLGFVLQFIGAVLPMLSDT